MERNGPENRMSGRASGSWTLKNTVEREREPHYITDGELPRTAHPERRSRTSSQLRQQWRRKQFASGGAQFFDVPPTFLL